MSRPVNIEISSLEAQHLLAAAKTARKSLKGEEAKPLQSVLGKLQNEIDKQKRIAGSKKDAGKTTELLDEMTSKFVNTLLVAKKRGITKDVVSYFSSVEQLYWDAHESVEAAEKKYKKTLPQHLKATQVASLPFESFEKVLAPFDAKLTKLTQNFVEAKNPTPLEADTGYSHAPARKKMAQKSFNAALAAGGIGGHWDDNLFQLAASFTVMKQLMGLGVAILKGSPTKIETALGELSDTAADYMGQDLVDFSYNALSLVERVKPKPSTRGPRTR